MIAHTSDGDTIATPTAAASSTRDAVTSRRDALVSISATDVAVRRRLRPACATHIASILRARRSAFTITTCNHPLTTASESEDHDGRTEAELCTLPGASGGALERRAPAG